MTGELLRAHFIHIRPEELEQVIYIKFSVSSIMLIAFLYFLNSFDSCTSTFGLG